MKDKNHYENQDTVPLPTQHSAHTYTACLLVFKVKTIPLIVSYKTEILIVLGIKSRKEGKMETPKTTRSLSMDTNGQKSIFLLDTYYRIKDIDKKKVFYKILHNLKYFGQNISTDRDTKSIYTLQQPPSSNSRFLRPKGKSRHHTVSFRILSLR